MARTKQTVARKASRPFTGGKEPKKPPGKKKAPPKPAPAKKAPPKKAPAKKPSTARAPAPAPAPETQNNTVTIPTRPTDLTVYYTAPTDVRNCWSEVTMIYGPKNPPKYGPLVAKMLHKPCAALGLEPHEYMCAWASNFTPQQLEDMWTEMLVANKFEFPPIKFTSIREKELKVQNYVFNQMRSSYQNYVKNYRRSKMPNSFSGDNPSDCPAFETWSKDYRAGIVFIRNYQILNPHMPAVEVVEKVVKILQEEIETKTEFKHKISKLVKEKLTGLALEALDSIGDINVDTEEKAKLLSKACLHLKLTSTGSTRTLLERLQKYVSELTTKDELRPQLVWLLDVVLEEQPDEREVRLAKEAKEAKKLKNQADKLAKKKKALKKKKKNARKSKKTKKQYTQEELDAGMEEPTTSDDDTDAYSSDEEEMNQWSDSEEEQESDENKAAGKKVTFDDDTSPPPETTTSPPPETTTTTVDPSNDDKKPAATTTTTGGSSGGITPRTVLEAKGDGNLSDDGDKPEDTSKSCLKNTNIGAIAVRNRHKRRNYFDLCDSDDEEERLPSKKLKCVGTVSFKHLLPHQKKVQDDITVLCRGYEKVIDKKNTGPVKVKDKHGREKYIVKDDSWKTTMRWQYSKTMAVMGDLTVWDGVSFNAKNVSNKNQVVTRCAMKCSYIHDETILGRPNIEKVVGSWLDPMFVPTFYGTMLQLEFWLGPYHNSPIKQKEKMAMIKACIHRLNFTEDERETLLLMFIHVAAFQEDK